MHFVGNMPPMHAHKLFAQLRAEFKKDIKFVSDVDLTQKCIAGVPIADRIKITASFNAESLKTQKFCDKYKVEKSPYLPELVDQCRKQGRNVVFVGHYPDDRAEVTQYAQQHHDKNWSCEAKTLPDFLRDVELVHDENMKKRL